MSWLLDNLQFVIIVATTIAWWLNQRHSAAKAAQEEEEARQRGEVEPPPFDFEEDMDEHARRVQEDIRRKIAERRGEGAPASPLETLFESREREPEMAFEEPPPVPVPVPPVRAEAAWGTEDAGALERTRRLDEELERLQRQQQQAERRARDVGVSAAGVRSTTPTSTGAYAVTAFTGSMRRADAHWLQTLRDPREARKAMVLRELLGPPVGLQK